MTTTEPSRGNRASAGKHIGAAGGRLAESRAFLKAFEAPDDGEKLGPPSGSDENDEDKLARRKIQRKVVSSFLQEVSERFFLTRRAARGSMDLKHPPGVD